MKIVFLLGDGRTIEMPTGQISCTYAEPSTAPDDASAEWLEDLWKLEDKRED